MKYTGRIILTLILIVSEIGWTLYNYYAFHNAIWQHLAGGFFYLPICWWVGKQFDKAKHLSEKDELTGLYNRRYIVRKFQPFTAKANKQKLEMSLAILDVNNFKNINDRHGHEVGDLVLKRVSECLLNHTRKGDVVARWGGDEILILFTAGPNHSADIFLEQIENEVQRLSSEMNMDISVSIGTAVYPRDGKDLNQLIRHADSNMYKMKKQLQSS